MTTDNDGNEPKGPTPPDKSKDNPTDDGTKENNQNEPKNDGKANSTGNNGKTEDKPNDPSKGKVKKSKRLSEAELLAQNNQTTTSFLRSGTNRHEFKSTDYAYRPPSQPSTSHQQPYYPPGQSHPTALYQSGYPMYTNWQPNIPYGQLNPMAYPYPPAMHHPQYHPRYTPNLSGSLPTLAAQSGQSSGDERKTVLNYRPAGDQRDGEQQTESESSDEEELDVRERSLSLGAQRPIGRPDYSSSFLKDITARLSVFSGEHFASWEREARTVLELTDLVQYINTDHSKATGLARKEDQMVAAYLEQHIAADIKNELNLVTGSAYDVWSALRYWHDDRDCSDLDRTYSNLRSIRLVGENIEDYKKEFLAVLKSLAKFGRTFPPDFLVHTFLEGLGDRGAHYRREYKRKQHLDPKTVCLEVCRTFEVSERRKIDHVARSNKQTGGNQKSKFKVSKLPFFQSRSRQTRGGSSAPKEEPERKIYLGKPNDKPAGVCWKCGDPNHQFKDCPKHKSGIRVLLNLVTQAHKSSKWLFDTGAAVAVVNSKSWFNEGTFVEEEVTFGSIDQGGTLQALGYGEVTLTLKSGVNIVIPNVFYCPKASVNVMTNIGLDRRIRFLIDSERGYMWTNEQDPDDYFQLCKVIDDENVIQLKETLVNAVTRSKANRTESAEPQKKRLKSAVSYTQRDSKPNRDEEADPKQPQDLRQKLNRSKQKADPKQQEDLREKLNRKSEEEEEDGLSTPIYVYEDHGGDLRELLGPNGRTDSAEESEEEPAEGKHPKYPKYPQKLFDINRKYYEEIAKQKFVSTAEMHEVNGHPGRNATSELCKIHGLSMKNFDCLICNKFNLTLKHSTKPSQNWTEGPNDMVHIDLCEPYPSVTAYDGARYFVMILDDYTGNISVYTVRDKSAETVLAIFRSYRAYAERWHGGRPVKLVKTDFGREFDNEKFVREILEMGHRHEYGAAYIHYQNGKAERAIRTIENKCVKLMEASGLDLKYWPEAAKTAAYLYGRTPRPNSIAPHVAWNRRYDARRLFRMGAKVNYCDPATTIRKASGRQKEAIFMSYDRQTNGYRVLDKETNRIVTQHFINYQSKNVHAIRLIAPLPKKRIEPPPTRSINPVLLLKKVKVKENIVIPRTEKEALSSKQSEKWREAMKNELQKMRDEKVFEQVPFTGQKTIETKWTFDYKASESRYSARLVARGDRQLPSMYEHTFAPTMPIHVLRLLLCIALNFNLIVWNIDVERAFLNARLVEAIFIRPPTLLMCPPGMVIRLRKALYGLKQAGHEWHKEVSATLREMGFCVMPREPCVFVHRTIPHLYIGLYVDDAIIVCESMKIKDHIIKELRKRYRLHDRGELSELLGIRFKRYADRFEYDLQKAIEKLCAQFRVDTDPRVNTPLIAGDIVSPSLNGLPADRDQFVSGLGTILYFARVGRPELAHPCAVLSQFRETPMKVHERRLKRLMVYLLNTSSYRMTIRASHLKLKVYTDASFASNYDFRSFYGTLAMFGETVIDWTSKKMGSTAQSTDESEIIGAYEAMRTLMYLKQLICEVIHGRLYKFDWQKTSPCHICNSHTPLLLIDNKATIAFCENGFGKRTRQLNVQYIALHEKLQDGEYKVDYVASKLNLADVFTKNLQSRSIEDFQEAIGYRV